MSDEKRPPDTLGVAGPSHASDQCTLSAERVIDSRENEQHIVCACKKEKNEHTEESSLADGILAKIKKEVMETIQFKSKLVNHKDLPEWAKDNSSIVKYHRDPVASYKYCFKTIPRLHTETGNIWSHGLGAILMAGILVYTLDLPQSQFVASFEEKSIISLFLISAILCLFFSMLYHTLSAHSERVLRIFGRLDFSGIALLVMGSFIPWVYYQFYCRAQPRVVYLITISLLGAAAIVFSQWERFAKPEYRVVRAAMFSSLGASGIIPMVHVIILKGAKYSFTQGQLQWMMTMFLAYGTGAILYATRFPGQACVLFGN